MSGQSANVFDESYTAAADLSTKQFFAMKLTAKNNINIASAATDRVWGILQNKPKSGNAAVLRHIGKTKAVVDGSGTSIAVGDLLGSDANGRLVKKATADYATCAIANDVSTAQGDVIEVFMLPPGYFRTAAG